MNELEVRLIVVDMMRQLAKGIEEKADHHSKNGRTEASLALREVVCELWWTSATKKDDSNE